MAFSTAQKAILGVAGLGAVGFGGYFVVQQAEVRKYEKDRADIVSLIDTEKKRAATATKAQSGAEERIAELQLAEQQSFKAIKDLELKLDAARKQVGDASVASLAHHHGFTRRRCRRRDALHAYI